MVIIQTTSLIYDRSAGKLAVAGGTSIFRAHFACRSSDQTLLVASGQNESAPETGALPNFNQSEPQAATLVGLTSKSLLELVIGITSRLQDNGCIRQDGMMTSHILALVVAIHGAQSDAVHGGPTSRDELVSARSSLQNA